MAARSASQAVSELSHLLQTALSCVTGSVLQHAPTARDAQPRVLTFPGDNLARLGRQDQLFLSIELSYISTVLADQKRLWRVEIPGYIYEFLDRDRRPIVSYHWHPVGRSHVITPHLHVGCRAGIADLSKVHLPTGPVTLVERYPVLDHRVQGGTAAG